MSKKYCIFITALFCAFIGVFLVANAVSPDRTFSEMENRNLEQLPTPSVKKMCIRDSTSTAAHRQASIRFHRFIQPAPFLGMLDYIMDRLPGKACSCAPFSCIV